jgi:hypothetical protein
MPLYFIEIPLRIFGIILNINIPMSDMDNRIKEKAQGFFRNVFKLIKTIILRLLPIIPRIKINMLVEILK